MGLWKVICSVLDRACLTCPLLSDGGEATTDIVPEAFLIIQEEGGSNVAVIFEVILTSLHLLVAKEQSSIRPLLVCPVEVEFKELNGIEEGDSLLNPFTGVCISSLIWSKLSNLNGLSFRLMASVLILRRLQSKRTPDLSRSGPLEVDATAGGVFVKAKADSTLCGDGGKTVNCLSFALVFKALYALPLIGTGDTVLALFPVVAEPEEQVLEAQDGFGGISILNPHVEHFK